MTMNNTIRIVLCLAVVEGFILRSNFQTSSIDASSQSQRKRSFQLGLTITQTNNGKDTLLYPAVRGRISMSSRTLGRTGIFSFPLWDDDKFSTDALAGHGSAGKFDPAKDRAVSRLHQWKP
jgi:hypothetical protein